MSDHLAVYSRKRDRDYIELMLNGQKTIDIKLFSRKIAPYKNLESGDRVYIKESSGPVVGTFTVGQVQHIEFVHRDEIYNLLLSIWENVGLLSMEQVDRMYEKYEYMRYATVFEIKQPVRLPPLRIFKRDRRVWVANWELPFGLEGVVAQIISEQKNNERKV